MAQVRAAVVPKAAAPMQVAQVVRRVAVRAPVPVAVKVELVQTPAVVRAVRVRMLAAWAAAKVVLARMLAAWADKAVVRRAAAWAARAVPRNLRLDCQHPERAVRPQQESRIQVQACRVAAARRAEQTAAAHLAMPRRTVFLPHPAVLRKAKASSPDRAVARPDRAPPEAAGSQEAVQPAGAVKRAVAQAAPRVRRAEQLEHKADCQMPAVACRVVRARMPAAQRAEQAAPRDLKAADCPARAAECKAARTRAACPPETANLEVTVRVVCHPQGETVRALVLPAAISAVPLVALVLKRVARRDPMADRAADR